MIAFDQDEDAKKQAENIQSRSFTFCQANFKYLKQYLKLNGITQVDGVLADLGSLLTRSIPRNVAFQHGSMDRWT